MEFEVCGRLGDFASEVVERIQSSETPPRVYGVERGVGLTAAKYQAADLRRYKKIGVNQFAYNPMRLNIGSIGICKASDGEGVVSPDYVVFAFGDAVDPIFFDYYTKTRYWQEWVARAGNGSVRERIYFKNLAEMPVHFPALQDQQHAAYVLNLLDDRINNLRQTSVALEAIAAELFKSWFVDFDGVPPEKMQESELGLIPKGWRVVAFGDVAKLGKGIVNPGDSPRELFTHYSLPAFDAGNRPFVEVGESIKSNKTPVPDNVVLVSKLNPHIPRIWLIGDTGERSVCSTEFTVWTPKAPANTAFLYCLASSRQFNSSMRQFVTGTSNSHQRVKPEQLASIRVFAASDEAIASFAATIEPLMRKLIRNREESATLAQLRDTLLPRIISGQLRVKQ